MAPEMMRPAIESSNPRVKMNPSMRRPKMIRASTRQFAWRRADSNRRPPACKARSLQARDQRKCVPQAIHEVTRVPRFTW